MTVRTDEAAKIHRRGDSPVHGVEHAAPNEFMAEAAYGPSARRAKSVVFARLAPTPRRRMFCSLVLLVLSGCTVGPDYKPPALPEGADAPLVSSAPVAAQPAPEVVTGSAAPPDDWWTLYHDQNLNDLVSQALQANTDLAVAAATVDAARAQLASARVALLPQTGVDVGAIYGRDPTTDEILELGGHEPANIWLYHAVLEASYEIDLWGHVRRTIEAVKADAAAAAAARDTARITIAAETVRAYTEVCALSERITVTQQSLDVAGNQLRITADRRDAGAGSDFDVVRSQALEAQTRAGLAPLEGERRVALLELTRLLGRTPAQIPQVNCERPPTLSALLPVGDGATFIRRRPDVRQAELRLHAATARIGVATSLLYPRISLLGDVGGANTELNTVFNNDGLVWGLGPGISWEFPNQSPVRARIAQAKAGSAAALAAFDGTVLTALKEVQAALARYTTGLQQQAALQQARSHADRAFQMAREQFLAGSSSHLELLTAQQTAIAADAAAAAADGVVAQDQVALFKALGGGWQQ